METAVFGGGCFWCVEAVFEEVPGVQSVVSGYAGGPAVNPTYDAVCTGQTGHAEVVQVTFDPSKVAYARLLETFWKAHDPTTLNRQGADAGTQYRSIILYQNDAQRITAETSRTEAQKRFTQPIVTELQPLAKFYPAEEYHQDYFRKNPNAAYCRAVIKPKLDKLKSTTK
jgi:peptide-methionine (S)-S-oxide reductase